MPYTGVSSVQSRRCKLAEKRLLGNMKRQLLACSLKHTGLVLRLLENQQAAAYTAICAIYRKMRNLLAAFELHINIKLRPVGRHDNITILQTLLWWQHRVTTDGAR